MNTKPFDKKDEINNWVLNKCINNFYTTVSSNLYSKKI